MEQYPTVTPVVAGYAHPLYAESLREFGKPRSLERSGGWLLERPIGNASVVDAMGCYPILACRDWNALDDDFRAIGTELVSVVLVTDPFGDFEESRLRTTFPDLMVTFKQHHIIDLSKAPETFVHPGHRRKAWKAMQHVNIELCPFPGDLLTVWVELYEKLKERHNIRGIAAFSRESFATQLEVPGATLFKATVDDEVVGILWMYHVGNVVYYHLGAYSEIGYRTNASFALFWRAIEHFHDMGASFMSLGAGAGATVSSPGLDRFKGGWATDSRNVFLCGRILDRALYAISAVLPGVPISRRIARVSFADGEELPEHSSSL